MRAGVACLLLFLAASLLACGGEEEVPAPPTESPTPAATEAPTPSPPLPAQTPGPSPTESALATDWVALIQGVADHLTANAGSGDCLAALFAQWNMPSDENTSCVAADLDGDGEDEYVVRLVGHPGPTDSVGYFGKWLSGKILIFGRSQEAFQPVFNLADLEAPLYACPDPPKCGEQVFSNPAIHSARDLNGDGILELVLSSGQCGAHTCHFILYIVTNRQGAYVSLLPSVLGNSPSIGVPLADDQLRIDDINGDGLPELILRQGVVTSAGARPQREAARTYLWDGESYALGGITYDDPDVGYNRVPGNPLGATHGNLRYFRMRDADDAFTSGEYQQAIQMYHEAVSGQEFLELTEWGSPAESLAYARFRIGLSLAAIGDAPGALAALDEAVAADPAALHSGLAQRYRDAYAPASDLVAGCAAALAFVDENADAFRQVWDYGYANPNPGAERQPLCPF